MSVIERWTIYEGINGTAGTWTERGDHPGWKGKLRGEFRRTVVVPESELQGAVDAALLALVTEAREVCAREGVDDVAGWIGKTVLARR